MVVTEDNRDSAELNVRENMDNGQPNGELVPRTEQNNDEGNVRLICILSILLIYIFSRPFKYILKTCGIEPFIKIFGNTRNFLLMMVERNYTCTSRELQELLRFV